MHDGQEKHTAKSPAAISTCIMSSRKLWSSMPEKAEEYLERPASASHESTRGMAVRKAVSGGLRSCEHELLDEQSVVGFTKQTIKTVASQIYAATLMKAVCCSSI